MKIIEVAKRDIYITLEFPVREILWLAALLDKAEINYEASDRMMAEAVKWLRDDLEPLLANFQSTFGLEDGGQHSQGSNSQAISEETFLG